MGLVALALPIAVLMRALRPILLVRVGSLNVTRIGHFATNTELYLCERDEGLQSRSFDLFFLPSKVSNSQPCGAVCCALIHSCGISPGQFFSSRA